MSVYTISPNLLRNINSELKIFADILFIFTQTNNNKKVAIDKDGVIINHYASIIENKELISSWLGLMTYLYNFEYIDLNIQNFCSCEETFYLKICKETQSQKKLITYSHQDIRKYTIIDNFVEFEQDKIEILDKSSASIELTNTQNTNTQNTNIQIIHISQSQFASNNSQINDSINNHE